MLYTSSIYEIMSGGRGGYLEGWSFFWSFKSLGFSEVSGRDADLAHPPVHMFALTSELLKIKKKIIP